MKVGGLVSPSVSRTTYKCCFYCLYNGENSSELRKIKSDDFRTLTTLGRRTALHKIYSYGKCSNSFVIYKELNIKERKSVVLQRPVNLVVTSHWHKDIEDLTLAYICVDVLLNLLNELWKKIRCEAVPSILSGFPNEFNKFNNTGTPMQYSIYHITLKLHFIIKFCTKTSRFHH